MSYYRPGRFEQLPMVVKNLLIINGLVFLLQNTLTMQGIRVDDIFALHYWQSPLFRWWQLFTHMFMHGSLMHIFSNMFALWMFGRILENVWGPRRFLMFYLICGLGAALCHLGVLTFEFGTFHSAFMKYQASPTLAAYTDLIKHNGLDGIRQFKAIAEFWAANPDCADCASTSVSLVHQYYGLMINEATVGASGAVFGLLFAFGYLFPNTELYLFFVPIPIKAKWFVAGYAVLELFEGIQNSAGDNVAHFAHLGGLLFGFIMLKVWKYRYRNDFY